MIKSTLTLSMVLLLVAGSGRLLRISAELFDTPRPFSKDELPDVD